MNEEIHGITNKRKTANNKWENDDSSFELYIVYIKN